jgi:signal transduction histidine kinase
MMKLRHIIALSVLVAISLVTLQLRAQEKDDSASQLLQKVRVTFNQNNEQEFYDAIAKYREYLLKNDDLSGFYLSWKNEVLYDVNHNHFYRALRKTMIMQRDMEKRDAKHEIHHTTHLRGIIYSLRGNIPLAHQYFEKALQEVDHSQPAYLVGLYMDLANIEMDTQPFEAMKHLNCAIEIIKADGASFEYSDAIGFKVIVAFAMRDWQQVNESYAEYIDLKDRLGNNFSTTYYNYAVLCKSVADKRFDDAIRQTYELTNTTDIYKFQTEIYELAGDTVRAFEAQKRYMAVKDSVNNVIMSEEMVGSANDLQNAELRNEAVAKRNQLLQWALPSVIIAGLLIGFFIYRMNRLRYLRNLQKQNRELLIARDKAQESERMKINFLQNMSHEIRTPLNVISGYAQIISSPNSRLSDAERADMALRITHSTSLIVHIVDEILDISGKESIHYLDKTDLVNCNELARDMLAPYIAHQDIIEVKLEAQLKDNYCILVNRHEVEKILHHLLDNAMKFTQQGSVTMRTYLDKLNNKMVCFSVTDTGCGVKEGDEEKIFEHFYKSDVYKEGVGLGLSLARRVARQLGGDVVLDSSYKEGCRFILSLPKE